MTNIYPLEALADPTRRKLVERLRQGPASVSQLLAVVQVSQPAVSQHLSILKQAQLVTVQKRGNRRIYQLNPEGLAVLRSYVEGLWDVALQAFQREAENYNPKEVTKNDNTAS